MKKLYPLIFLLLLFVQSSRPSQSALGDAIDSWPTLQSCSGSVIDFSEDLTWFRRFHLIPYNSVQRDQSLVTISIPSANVFLKRAGSSEYVSLRKIYPYLQKEGTRELRSVRQRRDTLIVFLGSPPSSPPVI